LRHFATSAVAKKLAGRAGAAPARPLTRLDRFPSGCRHLLGLPSRSIVLFLPPFGRVVSRGAGPADCGPAPTGDRRKGSPDSDASFTGGT